MKLTDSLIRLLASPGGLSSFLSTFNYTLYLLAYLETKTPSLTRLTDLFLNLLNYRRASSSKTPIAATTNATPMGPSPVMRLGSLLSATRTTLRLFGLLPLYAWMRTLLAGRKADTDPILHRIAFTQCVSYIAFQSLENIALLTDHNVLPATLFARLNNGSPPPTSSIYRWSYRAWLAGVSCDFFRLGREAVLERRRRTVRARSEGAGKTAVADAKRAEDDKVDEKWWSEFVVPCSWFPVAVHFSKETGVPGMNLGIMGACGAMAGLGKTSALWAATKDV